MINQISIESQFTETPASLTPVKLPIVFDWAKQHFRHRRFNKNEKIPARPGLIYIVEHGVVRLTGEGQESTAHHSSALLATQILEDTFLDLVSSGQPFEVSFHSYCQFQCSAQVDNTSVIWLYWEDLENWLDLKNAILNVFRYQHQRLLLRLNALGQRHTSDRLLLFLQLLIEDHGQASSEGNFLTFALTHTQLANAIGATRVTVTRAMSKLRRSGQLLISHTGLIGLPHHERRSIQS